MDASRRDFFRFGADATVVALGVSVPAVARGFVPAVPLSLHEEIARRSISLIDLMKTWNLKAEQLFGPQPSCPWESSIHHLRGEYERWQQNKRGMEEYRAVTTAGDDLIDLMMDRIDNNPDPIDVTAMFSGLIAPADATDIHSLLSHRTDLLPIAVLKNLIQQHRIQFNTTEMSGFDRFADRYRRHIMASSPSELSPWEQRLRSAKPEQIADVRAEYAEWRRGEREKAKLAS